MIENVPAADLPHVLPAQCFWSGFTCRGLADVRVPLDLVLSFLLIPQVSGPMIVASGTAQCYVEGFLVSLCSVGLGDSLFLFRRVLIKRNVAFPPSHDKSFESCGRNTARLATKLLETGFY